MNRPAPKPKYRPALTEDMLHELYAALEEGTTKTYLHQYLVKIGAGITNAAYVHNNVKELRKKSIEDALGFADLTQSQDISTKNLESEVELYNKWINDPLALTSTQLDCVLQYRYTNDLMSVEEESQYEASLLK